MNTLTWRNLGYRLGRTFGAQAVETIDETYQMFAYVFDRRGQPGTVLNTKLRRSPERQPEVPIGGVGGPGDWPPGCTVRRLDGVHCFSTGDPSILPFKGNEALFAADLEASPSCQIIEVKTALNRLVIGQALAGADMFQRQYGKPGKPLIVHSKGDTALEWVCQERGIEVVHVVERN